jgi:hypothetical protein
MYLGKNGAFSWDQCYDLLNIFAEKIQQKKLAFLTQNKAKLCKILIITLVFEKNANFFAVNCRKSQKIVIITSTPGFLFSFDTNQLHIALLGIVTRAFAIGSLTQVKNADLGKV